MLCPFIHSSLHLQIHSHSHFHYHTHANSHTPCQSHSFLNSSIIIVPSSINSKLLSSILTSPRSSISLLSLNTIIITASLLPSLPPALPAFSPSQFYFSHLITSLSIPLFYPFIPFYFLPVYHPINRPTN